MAYDDPASFLGNGTFYWDNLGYFYSEPPPTNLLIPEALVCDDPWIVLAATLEYAKIGRHAPIETLSKWISMDSPPLLFRGSLEILVFAGTYATLQRLIPILREGPDFLREEICWAIGTGGHLWFVPHMLDGLERAERATVRQAIAAELSNMLEEKTGPIFSYRDYSPQEYSDIVKTRMKKLQSQYGTDKLFVWRGKHYGVTALAIHMQQLLLAKRKNLRQISAWFVELRQRFESYTGINCSAFYNNYEFQPLAAAAILEKFLESSEPEKYEEGVRYFFGHRILD